MPLEEETGRGKKRGKGGTFATTAKSPFKERAVLRSWGGYSDLLMADAIRCVVTSGRYIALCRTADGGALNITVLDGDARHKTYCASASEVEEACTALIAAYGDEATPYQPQ